jgi:uncharacterized protein (TIGR02452 family)
MAGFRRGVIEVSEETVIQACKRVRSAFPDVPAAVLHFASSFNPLGRSGHQAREEAIARASALYSSIRCFDMFGCADQNPLDTDRMIYSPRVAFFRDDTENLMSRPFTISVITAAAPKANECVQQIFSRALPGTLKNRMRKIINAAVTHGDRILVLGAVGCATDPEMVANIEKQLLVDEELRYHFDFILNPIDPNSCGGNAHYLAFRDVLSRWAMP